jgi:hypothetical protein
MMGEVADIRAATQVPNFGLNDFSASPGPSNLPPQSPIREHPIFQPSPQQYMSPFQEGSGPPIEYRLLSNFVNNLCPDAPSPFKTEIFVECPTQKRALVQRPVSVREPDVNRGHTRWVEMRLVYDEPPKHRAHCVMAGSSKIVVDYQGSTVEADCSVWTRKYPEGWQGIYQNDAGKLINYDEPIGSNDTVWVYSAAVCVQLGGDETSVECLVPKRVVEVDGIKYDLEPAWQDVVNALKLETSVWPRLPAQERTLIEDDPQPQESLERTPKTPRGRGRPRKDKQATFPVQQPLPLQNYVPQAMEQQSMSHAIPASMDNGKSTTPPHHPNENPVPHYGGYFEPANRPQPHPFLGWNPLPLFSYHEGIPGRMDSGVQQASHAHMQESAGPSQAAEPASHVGTEENSIPSQTVDAVSQVPMDGNNMPYQVVNPAPVDRSNTPSQVNSHIPSMQDTVASVIAQQHQDPLPGQEQSKPKRKRAPQKEKQTQSMQNVQEPSGQPGGAAEAETPPSTKAGTKRKNSTATRTPAKKTTAAKKTPATKTPAKKRSSSKATMSAQPSEGRDGGSEKGETAAAVQDNIPELPMQFGLQLPAVPSTGFDTSRGMRMNQLSPGSSRPNQYNQPGQPSIYQQLEYIDREHMKLVNTLPQIGSNPTAAHTVQHRMAQLIMTRNQLLGMNYGPMYQPINGYLPNNQVHLVQQYNGFDLSNQVFISPQIYASPYNSDQMSGMSENNGSTQNLPHSPAQQWNNHLDPCNQSSQPQQGPQPTTSYSPPGAPGALVAQLRTPTHSSLAAWSQEDVQRARSSVQSTLGKPVYDKASNYGWIYQQDAIDPELRNS